MGLGAFVAARLGAGALSSLGDRSRKREMGRLTLAEKRRQGEYYRKMIGSLSEAMGRYAPGQQLAMLEDATAERQGSVAEALTPIPDELQGVQGVGSAPAVVSKDAARSLSEALAEGRDRSMKLAANSGYDDANFNNQVAMGRTGEKLGRTRMFADRSLGLLDGEMRDAASSGSGFDRLASLANLGASFALQSTGKPTAADPGFYPKGDAYGPSTEFYKRIR